MRLRGHTQTGGPSPSWWAEYEGKTPCDCDAPSERVKEYVGYSDFGFFLNECPGCGSRWRTFIEG